jgi:hypothetical protein
MEEEEIPERKLFSTFEKHGEFVNAQQSLLSLNLGIEPTPEEDYKETVHLQRLCSIVRRIWRS